MYIYSIHTYIYIFLFLSFSSFVSRLALARLVSLVARFSALFAARAKRSKRARVVSLPLPEQEIAEETWMREQGRERERERERERDGRKEVVFKCWWNWPDTLWSGLFKYSPKDWSEHLRRARIILDGLSGRNTDICNDHPPPRPQKRRDTDTLIMFPANFYPRRRDDSKLLRRKVC